MQITKREFLKKLGMLTAAGATCAVSADEFVAVRDAKELPPGAIGDPKNIWFGQRIYPLPHTIEDGPSCRLENGRIVMPAKDVPLFYNADVVFYGTSVTHGGCASRPGMAFPSIVGRALDVPIVNLGFSGSGVMEFEMSEHLARIDASCYVLDCLGNMGLERPSASFKGYRPKGYLRENYEPFIRNLRRLRPEVPIVMASDDDVYNHADCPKNSYLKGLYKKLVAEGWKNLVFLPGDHLLTDDGEGTVDGSHPNDYGMKVRAEAYGAAVRDAIATSLRR